MPIKVIHRSSNPYADVIADLERKRSEIDKLIESLRQFAALAPAVDIQRAAPPAFEIDYSQQPHPQDQLDAESGGGEFSKMTFVDAAKSLLAREGRPLTNAEVVAAFEKGGLRTTSRDKLNTIGSILNRRVQTHGDIVRIGKGRGMKWALPEWQKVNDEQTAGEETKELL